MVAEHVKALQNMCARRGGGPDATAPAEGEAGAGGLGASDAGVESKAPPPNMIVTTLFPVMPLYEKLLWYLANCYLLTL